MQVTATCKDGPAKGQSFDVTVPPPKAVPVEVDIPSKEHEDPIATLTEGDEFPIIESRSYGYRLANDFLPEARRDDKPRVRTIEYEFDPDLDPEMAEYVS